MRSLVCPVLASWYRPPFTQLRFMD